MKEKATIYDMRRMCKAVSKKCSKCPLSCMGTCDIIEMSNTKLKETNKLILNWCKEHPVKTRQDKFLEMFPSAHIDTDGVLEVQPCHINENIVCKREDDCNVCRGKYWFAEVEE